MGRTHSGTMRLEIWEHSNEVDGDFGSRGENGIKLSLRITYSDSAEPMEAAGAFDLGRQSASTVLTVEGRNVIIDPGLKALPGYNELTVLDRSTIFESCLAMEAL